MAATASASSLRKKQGATDLQRRVGCRGHSIGSVFPCAFCFVFLVFLMFLCLFMRRRPKRRTCCPRWQCKSPARAASASTLSLSENQVKEMLSTQSVNGGKNEFARLQRFRILRFFLWSDYVEGSKGNVRLTFASSVYHSVLQKTGRYRYNWGCLFIDKLLQPQCPVS